MPFIPRLHVVESGGRLTLTGSPGAMLQARLSAAALAAVAAYFALDTGLGLEVDTSVKLLAMVGGPLALALWTGWEWHQGRLGGSEADRWTFDRAADEVRQGADVVCSISDVDSVNVRVHRNHQDERRGYVLVLKVAGLRKARQAPPAVPSMFDADIPVVRSSQLSELLSYAGRIATYTGAPRVDET
jgi:hypothetical protein